MLMLIKGVIKMADKKINTLQLKKFMEKQIEELDEIKKLRAELKIEKNDKNFVNSLDYLERMHKACEETIKMCDMYDEKQKAEAKKEADKIKAAAKEIKSEDKKDVIKKTESEPITEEDDDDIWD